MELFELIEALERLEEPNRRADERIGQFAGWERRSEPMNDNRETIETVYWVHDGKRYPRMPYFTTSIDAALLAVEALLGPRTSGGVTLGRGPSWAQIDDGPQCGGCTPALALVIAALRRKQQID
ncbi:hypothetical protein CO661_14255 [Sinorhizobium fredii]|uniref:Phage ABA sandwich domain-containing protein n=1 Tax=Rhizobium fredii TaxID=380 RepID=A0A2A6LXS2_RHIFR|nr:hypothetical protein [Sinorhizobium fredii]PDT47341.1 hypothetical protein CO661_14255 [Sinorhizobium fredii]